MSGAIAGRAVPFYEVEGFEFGTIARCKSRDPNGPAGATAVDRAAWGEGNAEIFRGAYSRRRIRRGAGGRRGPADQEAAARAYGRSAAALDLAFRDHRLRLGDSIAGSTGFGSLPTLPYYASFGKVLEHFQGAFMGSVVARNDTFIGGIDFIWARIGGSGTLSNPDNALYGGKTSLTLNESVITAFGGVRVPLGVPNLDLYGTVGARNFYSGNKLTVSGPFGLFNGTETVNKDWVMPVAGFAAQYRYDDRWFMNMLADLGGWSDSRNRAGACLRRLQLDAEHRNDHRLSRHVHLHPPGHRLQ